MDTSYLWALLLCGLGMLGAAWLPSLLKRRLLSLPMLCLALGLLASLIPWSTAVVGAISDVTVIEKFSELCVLIALAGAGLSIDRELTWKAWLLPRRLLFITMPLTIVAGTLLAYGVLDLPLGSALLLGAVLSPTDPVLASDVQVEEPNEACEDRVKFALTSEASLNDALAFPFTALAIAYVMYAGQGEMWLWEWVSYDLIYRIVMGIIAGGVIGFVVAKVTFDALPSCQLTHITSAMLVLGLTLVTYVLTEYVHGYGFLAVFIAALILRRMHKRHEHHDRTHHLATQVEHILMVVFLIGFGLVMGQMTWRMIDWKVVLVSACMLVLVRPAAGMIGLMRQSQASKPESFAMSFLGIKGIGSMYYLAYALNKTPFQGEETLWAVVSVTLIGSVVMHGASAHFLMKRTSSGDA